jgi:hypothetical protein
LLKWAALPLAPLIAITPEQCADRLGKVLWQDRYKTGWWRVDSHGEPIKTKKPTTEVIGKAVYDHISGLVDRK